MRHGVGKIIFENYFSFTGQFKKGLMVNGVLTKMNGDKYRVEYNYKLDYFEGRNVDD